MCHGDNGREYGYEALGIRFIYLDQLCRNFCGVLEQKNAQGTGLAGLAAHYLLRRNRQLDRSLLGIHAQTGNAKNGCFPSRYHTGAFASESDRGISVYEFLTVSTVLRMRNTIHQGYMHEQP